MTSGSRRDELALEARDGMYLEKALDFEGRVAVLTGGSGVLFSELALALGRRRAAVVVIGHGNMPKAEAVAERIVNEGGTAIAIQADVLDKAALLEAGKTVVKTFGLADILVNGAGGAKKEATTSDTLSFFDLPEDAVRWVLDLNFMGTFLACQVFGQHMVERSHGCILNISSIGAFRPLTRSVAYSAAKAAVTNFTQWLAVHMSQEYSTGIRVNALVPGFFLTEQNRFLLLDEQSNQLTARGQRILDHTPMQRFGHAEDLVGPALLLLSGVSGFVHGTTLVVDGGLSAYGGI